MIAFFIFVGICYLMIYGCLHMSGFFAENKKQSVFGWEDIDTQKENFTESPAIIQKDIKIVLDAGHGGKDDGTSYEGEKEKDINLAVVEKMREILEQNGFTVILTRSTDEFISLDERVDIANQLEADLFISIHCNDYPQDTSIKGLECYFSKDSIDGEGYAKSIIEILKKRGNITTRNAKSGDYRVLRNTKMPAVLIELGFISNREERESLVNNDYQKKLAEELVECILQNVDKTKY